MSWIYNDELSMKKFLLIILVGTATISSLAQQIEADPRLEVKFSNSELQAMKNDSPEELSFLNYCLDHAYIISDYKEKKSGNSELKSISIQDINNVNFFALNIELNNEIQYFQIEGVDKILVIQAENALRYKFKNDK